MHQPSTEPARLADAVLTADLRQRPLRLRIFPDAVLRQHASLVPKVNPDVHRLARDMLDLMRAARGIGLAAPQVGLLLRLIVVDIGQGPVCLVNPEVSHANGLDRMEEGCLSLPGLTVDVGRATSIIVSAWDIDGRSLRLGVSGLLARVIQHEIDHLDGILILDHGPRIVPAPAPQTTR